MISLLRIFLSPEKIAARLEMDLQRAVLANNQQKIVSIFCKSFVFLLKEKKAQLLSNLILSYGSKIGDSASLERQISSIQLKKAASFLEENRLDSAALMICEYAGYDAEAIEILVKRGRANDLAMYITRDKIIDKELLGTAVTFWEKHNGDIRKSPTMGNVLINIAEFAPESIPDNPRVREIIGQFKEAAVLYVKEGDLHNAARCYEETEMYEEACRIYEEIGDNERASRAAESLGDLEKALKLVVDPERKLRLLIRMERFREAREFAAGLESPDEYFDLIKEQAKKRMEVKIKGHDFIGAMELADIAECEFAEREEILLLGRQHFDRKITSAASEEDIKLICRDRVKLEEKAGHFEEAGRLAEEVLGDLALASFLYEKANLFNRAIDTASGHSDRLAELHEKGGNLLKAAKLYESAEQYDKAFVLYESIQYFHKAVECYLKTGNPSQEVPIRLYTKAGEFEKVVEIYMKSGTFSDLEKALSIATAHKLTSHIRIIKEKISEFVLGGEKDLERCFINARDEVLDSYSQTIGIDFGTTNSVAAIFNKKNKKVEIILAPGGSEYVPSFFGVDENNYPIFGEKARLRSLTAPDCVVARVKRSLGEKKSFSVGGTQYRSEEVVANFLQHLLSNAEAYVQSKVEARFYDLLKQSGLKFPAEVLRAFLNKQKGYNHIEDVILSVPAYFNDNQKRATRDSAEIAGLRVRRLLHEPSAAALAYGYQKSYSGKLAVIDLGGGTLDISIVDIGEGVNDVRTIGGDTKLGGSDIDDVLVQHTMKNVKQLWGIDIDEKTHSTEIARLREACENLKINLSSVTQYTIELPYFLNRPRYTFTLTRTELEHLAESILARVKSTIQKTIKEYGSSIDNFILVGNATKMPAVRDLVKRTISAKQLTGIDPGTVVATGAALQGSILTGGLTQIVLLDIVPYSLGISVIEGTGEKEIISRLIEKNSTIPIKKSDVYTTKEDNQSSVHIKIYQGESSQPHRNYFLGDFVLEGIPPAPAHTPKIEVTFDIGADCVLTVTAVDKATGNKRSIRIERAVVLSPQEKQNLSNYFAQREKVYSFEKELEQVRLEIDSLKLSCEEAIRVAEHTIQDFFEQFHEKVEVNPQLYKANPDQIREIQDMFIQKDQFIHGIPKYHDQFASILNNLRQIETRHLDFSESDIASKLKDRIDALTHYKQALENTLKSVEKNVTMIVGNWIQILESMEPDLDKMNPLEVASYHLTAGRANKARGILESLASSAEGLTKEAFRLLLECYVSLGLKEEYRDTHKRFGSLFGIIYPDFNRLNSYLKAVDDSVFMIQGVSEQHVVFFGSGFCIAPNLIATSRHVVEGTTRQQIEVVGKNTTYKVDRLELDPINDLAILRVSENLKPFKIGEFSFVEPGEQVLALGFPSPSSNIHSENIYISKGIVNSIRKIDVSPERVIFIDTKIGSGMSGGPLINELGEVVGIVTLVQYGMRPSGKGMLYVENQPVALPIDLVRKYVTSIY
ncbi:MAG: Hsp70 family protein [Candidatus Thorarchaeota archaeon]